MTKLHKNWRVRVFESLTYPTLVLKPDRTIVAANKQMLEKIGAPEDQVVGRTCRDIFEHHFFEEGLPCTQATCPLDLALVNASGHSIQRQVQRRDGTISWEDRFFSPILDDRGKVIYIIESIRDITWTKKLEHMLDGMRNLVNRIVQSSASAIVASDRNGRILLMNAAAEELFGYSLENISSIKSFELYPEGVARDIMEKLRSDTYGGRGKLPPTRIHIRTSLGEHIPVEMTGGIIYESGREMATMGIYNDLRERIRMERKLRQAENRLIQSEKMASLGRLAAGVAHEINNPLTGIMLYGNITLENLKTDDALRANVMYILEDAERCQEIVQNLLTYSRQQKAELALFRLNSLVEESVRLIRDQKMFIGIAVKWELTDRPVQVMADRNRMRQVIINLVMNAIDAMGTAGSLTLRTYESPGERTACLEIEDSGGGIARADLPRIFDPFFTTKPTGQGTGLGLSTSFGIVRDNEGDIQVKKTGPKGTTFLVKLPLAGFNTTGMPESVG